MRTDLLFLFSIILWFLCINLGFPCGTRTRTHIHTFQKWRFNSLNKLKDEE